MMSAEERKAYQTRLAELTAKHGGILTAEAVLEDAKHKASPLHDYFDWDVQKAAHQHWVEQARQLIRSVRVVITTETRTVSTVAYVRDPTLGGEVQGYRLTTGVRTDADLSRDVLVDELDRVVSALKRTEDLADAFGLAEEVHGLLADVERLRDRLVESAEEPA